MPPKKQSVGRQALTEVANKANCPPIQMRSSERDFTFDDAENFPGLQAEIGQKRKATKPVESADLDDIDCEGMRIDQNCDQVRRKIRRFLDSGSMKVGEFCKAIGVSNNSLNTFLGQSGKMKGFGSNTYMNAWEFFKKRELAGLKIPQKKQKSGAAEKEGTEFTTKGAKKTGGGVDVDISGIHLPGEESDDVSVFDTCDEVRRKINAHLKKPGVTQAQFCRDAQDQLHSGTKISSAQLSAFRDKKGARTGNTSSMYYAAYVFFEKLRIKEGKAKSKHREEMESIHLNGMDRKHGDHRGYFCFGGERPHVDKYGQVSIH